MTTIISYSIYINGEKAVKAAEEIIGNRCYKNLGDLGQIEIVLNDDRIYNGRINKWVAVYGLKTLKAIESKIIPFLKNQGFSGCYAKIYKEIDDAAIINQITLNTLTI